MCFFYLIIGALASISVVSATNSNTFGLDAGSTRNESFVTEESYFLYQHSEYPRDCKEVFQQCKGESYDGVHLIQPDGLEYPFAVYCNNTVDGGGWIVIQRRIDGNVHFHRYWEEYKNGFGFPHRDVWLGNEKLAFITNQKDYELRIDFISKGGDPYFAKYDLFRVSDEGSNFTLVELGEYDASSTVGYNAMDAHRGQPFSTKDHNSNGESFYHCAYNHGNAWWFKPAIHYPSCWDTMPNYEWNYIDGPIWRNFPGGYNYIQYIDMKIRPL